MSVQAQATHLWRDIPHTKACSTGSDDKVDLEIVDPVLQPLVDLRVIIRDDVADETTKGIARVRFECASSQRPGRVRGGASGRGCV